VNLVRRDKDCMEQIRADFNESEKELRRHPDFAHLQDLDLDAIACFRKVVGLGDYVSEGNSTIGLPSIVTQGSEARAFSSVAPPKRRLSNANSSISSFRTKGTQASLSPVDEGVAGDEADQDSSPSPKKRRQTDESPFSVAQSRSSAGFAPFEDGASSADESE